MNSDRPALLTHIAVLVPSLTRAVERVTAWGLPTQPFEEFEHEGTRECYVGDAGLGARLLVVEARSSGPYREALAKRGPGLHHLGVWISDAEAYAERMARAGWLLHARSLASLRRSQTIYFARPGIPFLVEAYVNAGRTGEASIGRMVWESRDPKLADRVKALGIANASLEVCVPEDSVRKSTPMVRITIGDRELALDELY